MKAHLVNACYGLLDYAAYPVTMLFATPVLLRYLGTSEYGMLAFSMAAVNTGAIIASGFGDANIQQIAIARAGANSETIQKTVQCTLGIHFLLGGMLMLAGLLCAPWLAGVVARGNPAALRTSIQILQISSFLVLLRTLETVAVSTHRAFEAYGEAVRISAAIRALSMIAAAGFAFSGLPLRSIFIEITVLSSIGTVVQVIRVGQKTSFTSLKPRIHREELRSLLAFGRFTWLQATGAVVFSQVDRLLIGISMGPEAVAGYSLAAQLSQPISGSTASALHFLFPHLANRAAQPGTETVKRPVWIAFGWNLSIVIIEAVPLLVFGRWFLQKWAGQPIAQMDAHVLPLLVMGTACTALGVTGNYAMLALGYARTATWITLASGGVMLLVAALLLPRWGAVGMAFGRLACGLTSLLIYRPLKRRLMPPQSNSAVPTMWPAKQTGVLR